jgi:hypothetical protein
VRGEGGGWSSVTRGGLRMVGSRSRAGEGIVRREFVACAAVEVVGSEGGDDGWCSWRGGWARFIRGAHREFSRQTGFKVALQQL